MQHAYFSRLGIRLSLALLALGSGPAAYAQAPLPGRVTAPSLSWNTTLQNPALNGELLGSPWFMKGLRSVADSAGNVYVTGALRGAMAFGGTTLSVQRGNICEGFVAKLSPTGQWLWAERIGTPIGSTGFTAGQSIALDNNGNVVVAGLHEGAIHFNPTLDLAASGRYAAFVARISPQGQWLTATTTARSATGRANGAIYDVDLALDAQGCAYLTGWLSDSLSLGASMVTTRYDYSQAFVAKLDPAGHWRWVVSTRTSNNPQPTYVAGSRLVLGSGGQLHLLGTFSGNDVIVGTTQLAGVSNVSPTHNKFIAHLDTAGQWLGAQLLGSFEGGAEFAADAQDNLYVSGSFVNSLTLGTHALQATTPMPGYNNRFTDPFVARLSAAGIWTWARTLPFYPRGIIQARPLRPGPGNALYVGGNAQVRRLDALTGADGWVAATGTFLNDDITDLRLDGQGQLVVAGGFAGVGSLGGTGLLTSTYQAAFVARLSAQGQWLPGAGQSHNGGSVITRQLLADAQGRTYVTGNFTGTVPFGSTALTAAGSTDIFIARLSAQGQPEWAVQAGGPRADGATHLALDARGNVLISGFADTLAAFGAHLLPRAGQFVARVSPQGQWQWATPTPRGLHGLTAGAHGAATIAGTFSGSLQLGSVQLSSHGGTDGYLAQLDSLGQLQWAAALGGIAADSVLGLAADAGGNTVVTGAFRQSMALGSFALTASDTLPHAFIAGLTSAGQWRWSQTVASAVGRGSVGTAVALDPAGQHLRAVGYHTDSAGVANPWSWLTGAGYVMALDPATGQPQWNTVLQSSVSTCRSVSVDAQGDAYVLGAAFYSIQLGSDTLGFRSAPPRPPVMPALALGRPGSVLDGPPVPASFAFLGRISSTGSWQWGMNADTIAAAVANPAGFLFITGQRIQDPYTSWPQPESFVAAIMANLLATPNPVSAGTFTMWPNPAREAVQLSGLPAGQPVRLFDALGRLVRSVPQAAGTTTATLALPAGLPGGVYIVRCGTQTRRLIVE